MLCLNNILEVEACSPSSLRLYTEAEIHDLVSASNPLALSTADASSIAWMIILVWTIAFTIKQLIKALSVGDLSS